jgi:predicted lipid-binding transport protein (Tim44 family)
MALALTSRRGALAAVASALAAMALAAAVAGRSCRVTQPGPEAAVRDMIQAAKTGDRGTVFELLTPATRDRLEAEARRATDLVGASQRYTAKDLISIGSSDAAADPTDITVLEEHSERAVVEIVSPAGRARVDLVKLEGRWRIDLPQYGSL